MASIARLVSFDGGIAFSQEKLKIQKRDRDAVIMPLEEVTAVRVRKPQEDSDGFLRVETADGRRFRLFFDEDQLQEAVQFKRQFDAAVSGGADQRPPAPAPRKASPSRPAPQGRRGGSARPARARSGGAPQRSIFQKWWFWVVCAVVVIGLVGAIAAIAGSKGGAPGGTGGDTPPAAGAGDAATVPEQTGAGAVTVGDYAVEIKDAFKTTDFEGKPAIVVTYTWTNNSDETTSALVSLIEKAFQDGIQLETAFLYDVDGYDANGAMTEIRPGISLDVQAAFLLNSNSPVEVEINALFGLGDPAVKTFDPNDL